MNCLYVYKKRNQTHKNENKSVYLIIFLNFIFHQDFHKLELNRILLILKRDFK